MKGVGARGNDKQNGRHHDKCQNKAGLIGSQLSKNWLKQIVQARHQWIDATPDDQNKSQGGHIRSLYSYHGNYIEEMRYLGKINQRLRLG